jgi:phosphopantothenoylcysteine synthetase/decarboxylase
MNVLITAGNTQVLLDRVRCITNIFTGRTGTRIALHAHGRGHAVTLLTSTPGVVTEQLGQAPAPGERWTVLAYRTFEDLHRLLEQAVGGGGFDAVIHSAAVSDYRGGGFYSPAPGTRFDVGRACWEGLEDQPPTLLPQRAGKVKSNEPELWLRLVRTPKLIDLMRSAWSFRGVLVKFKLEVGVDDEALRQIAEQSRSQSGADLMVANTLEEAGGWALLGPLAGAYLKVPRSELEARLLDEVERLRGLKAGRPDRECGHA